MSAFHTYLTTAVLTAVLVSPVAAQAGANSVKTRIVFYDANPRGHRDGLPMYGFETPTAWSFETTSVPAPTVKGRLLYYRSSSKKWVGYAGKTVHVTYARPRKTDARGYFRLNLAAPQRNRAVYYGSKYSRPCMTWVDRIDYAKTETSSTLATSSVDASHTLICAVIDYRYSPHVLELAPFGSYVEDGIGVDLVSSLVVGDVGAVFVNTSHDYNDVERGSGHSEWAYVVPNELIEGQLLAVRSKVEYQNVSIRSMYW
jgi:hypothetical protein